MAGFPEKLTAKGTPKLVGRTAERKRLFTVRPPLCVGESIILLELSGPNGATRNRYFEGKTDLDPRRPTTGPSAELADDQLQLFAFLDPAILALMPFFDRDQLITEPITCSGQTAANGSQGNTHHISNLLIR